MRFTETILSGVYLIDLDEHADDRGFFSRVWCRREFEQHGLDGNFVQCNGSFSHKAGTLRGLHYQAEPFGEAKLIRCISGRVFDVVVDLRSRSNTCGRWFGAELTQSNRTMMYVPAGCAHGYMTLVDASEVLYPVTAFYAPEAERGVRWDDPAFAIEWPRHLPLTISAKDQNWPDYAP